MLQKSAIHHIPATHESYRDNSLVTRTMMFFPDSFDMGFDIQHYYSMHQNLTLEDLAKASSKHPLKGLVKVINKVRLLLDKFHVPFGSE